MEKEGYGRVLGLDAKGQRGRVVLAKKRGLLVNPIQMTEN